ncbi:uncharacterized protein LOC107823736 isoform X2 [Nicotiana tabacum]|uniref:Uncharacterized protein LOC107823736 isoform X2 n=1 Tax=Nicotiana tabacum TaxID=4097 RepID=A0A1S4CXP4_TOBAC|nr:PREDICTED: uncharacterized protein LOC107823736 [Nicotiana tabacum]
MKYVKLYKFHGSQEDESSSSIDKNELADDKQMVKRFKAAMQKVILKFESKKSQELNEMCTALIIYIGSEPSYALNPDWEGVRSTRTRTNLTLFHSLKATDFCCLET